MVEGGGGWQLRTTVWKMEKCLQQFGAAVVGAQSRPQFADGGQEGDLILGNGQLLQGTRRPNTGQTTVNKRVPIHCIML